jgi:3-oxoacyl-[acyl-carrier protein] reductase
MNILITGGASGLGEAITLKLASDSANKVFFTYFKSKKRAGEIESKFSNTKAIACDFEDEQSVTNLLSIFEKENIQVLVNNAFTGLSANYFHKTDANYFLDNFSRNILPVIKVTQQAILHFRKQKFGKIVTVLSSYIINKPPIGMSEYVASKNYLLSLSKSWATENVKFNIVSNCISPSTMLTNLTSETDERIIEEMQNAHPLKKLITPVEVADSINYLINASQQINGTNMILNAAADLM